MNVQNGLPTFQDKANYVDLGSLQPFAADHMNGS